LQIYISSILNLCATKFFSNKFDSISKENKCDCLFIYAKIMLNLYLINAIIENIKIEKSLRKLILYYFIIQEETREKILLAIMLTIYLDR
jgi:hypothetical protein